VSSKGLWSYRGGLVPAYAASRTEVELIYDKLRLFDGTSPGYFDFMNAGQR
jgi:hypothetical protein